MLIGSLLFNALPLHPRHVTKRISKMQNFPRTALFVATLMATASLAYADDAAKPADAAAPAAAPAEAPKPPPAGGATLTDILGNSGVELKGYIDVAASGTDLASLGNPYKINDNDHSALSAHKDPFSKIT